MSAAALLDEIVDQVIDSTGAAATVDTDGDGPAYRLTSRTAGVRLIGSLDDQIDLVILCNGRVTRSAEFHHMPPEVVAAAVIRILMLPIGAPDLPAA